MKPEDLHATPIPGIYELLRGADAAYVSPDGKYAIVGDLYETGTNNNLTENRRRDQRLKMLAAIPESQMVVFGPDNAKHTITRIHGHGLRLLPQAAQPDQRLQQTGHQGSLHRLSAHRSEYRIVEQGGAGVVLSGPQVPPLRRPSWVSPCRTRSVRTIRWRKNTTWGQQFNLQGTPTLILGNGEMVPGYLAPADLVQELKGIDR